MKKILMISLIALNTSFAANVLAEEVQCPTVEQLRHEWSPTNMRYVEQTQNGVTFYQVPHHYGTNLNWYVVIDVADTNVNHALDKAIQAIKTAFFIGGGLNGFGFYCCSYSSAGGQMIYANANKIA